MKSSAKYFASQNADEPERKRLRTANLKDARVWIRKVPDPDDALSQLVKYGEPTCEHGLAVRRRRYTVSAPIK